MLNTRPAKIITIILIILLLIALSGCQSGVRQGWEKSKQPWQEIFRNDQSKNKAKFPINNQINYRQYDQQAKFEVFGDRAYGDLDGLSGELEPISRDGIRLEPPIEKLVDLPAGEEIAIPELGAKGFKDGQGNVIVIYPARNPAPDLKFLLEKFLTGIEVSEYPNQNKLLIKFPETMLENPQFMKQLGVTLDKLDQPATMVRVKFSAFYLWLDNTYNRELVIDILKGGIEAAHINLPSSYNADQHLTTGIRGDPFYNVKGWKDFSFEGSIGFLDSIGDIENLISVDALIANTKSFSYLDQLKVPYPNYILSGTSVVETVAFEDVGPDLKITPFANENGFITIKIDQAKSGELAALLEKTQRPTFKKGDFTAEFTLKNGVPYVGVVAMSNRFHSVKRGLPLLNKVPLFKSLGSSLVIEKNQSELIILVEARVMPRDLSLGTSAAQPVKKY